MGAVWEAFEKERVNQKMRPVKAAVYIKDGKFRARREDFGGCPINDVSKMSRFVMSSMTPWEPKVSATQWVGLVSRMDENLKAREDAEASSSSSGNASILKWDMAQTEDAEEWYKSICTSEMVRMSALLFLSSEGIPVAISKSASKSDIVAALLAEEIPMCPPYVLQALFESMPMVAAEVPLTGSGKGTDAVGHDSSLASPQPKRKVVRVADVGTPQKLAIKGPQGDSEDTEPPYTPPAGGESVTWMKALVKAFQEASGTKLSERVGRGQTRLPSPAHGARRGVSQQISKSQRGQSWRERYLELGAAEHGEMASIEDATEWYMLPRPELVRAVSQARGQSW
jgi:hypothetical protein